MLLSFLNKPYPFIGNIKRALINNFFIGLFVAFFLIFFQPFQINTWYPVNKTLILAGFGFISFVVPSLANLLIIRLQQYTSIDKNWTILKEIITILFILASIAMSNLIYGKFLFGGHFGFYAYLNAFGITCLVGVFPVILHVILKHNKLLKINLEQTLLINEQLKIHSQSQEQKSSAKQIQPNSVNTQPDDSEIKLLSENEKEMLQLKPDQLLYVESADNYSNVVYINENGKPAKFLIRSSLKRIEGQIQHSTVLRCHRTYIVNLNMVKQVDGNAAGYKLHLHHCPEILPVSRNYIAVVSEKLRHLQ